MLRKSLFAGVCVFLALIPASAEPASFFREVGESTRVEQRFEQRCSFQVQPLEPGLYVARVSVLDRLAWLWREEPRGQSNRWLYSHVAGDCRASQGRTGYMFTWLTHAQNQWSVVLAGVGGTATITSGEIRLRITQPTWLSGEVGVLHTFERIGR